MTQHFLCFVLVWLAIPAAAHVGSPDVFYEGNAGPYHVSVMVRVPQVIPGVAEVEVRCPENDVSQVSIVGLRLRGEGAERAPAAETARRSTQEPQLFSSSLWLMESGALQIRVQVFGGRGKGEIAVPIPSVAQRKLPMSRPLGLTLFVLLVVLAAGVLSIAVAGAGEAMLPPGAVPSHIDRRRAQRVMVAASFALLCLLYLGRRWWNAEDAKAAARVYKAPGISATLEAPNRLRLQARDSVIYLDDLIPDHGHLMHLFLVRTPAMDHFLHLHPEKAEGGRFAIDLPSLPAGHYKIFADVVHQSGFPATLVGEADLPDLSGSTAGGDDTEWSGSPVSPNLRETTVATLSDGSRMVWERSAGPLKSGVAGTFRFRVEDSSGLPVQDLQPYMGMAGHAEFVRSDLSVFAHVHPAGSVSMAAAEIAQQGLLESLGSGKDAAAEEMSMPMSGPAAEISFPYGFPEPGEYRIFVQVKRAGRIETGVFDASVN